MIKYKSKFNRFLSKQITHKQAKAILVALSLFALFSLSMTMDYNEQAITEKVCEE